MSTPVRDTERLALQPPEALARAVLPWLRRPAAPRIACAVALLATGLFLLAGGRGQTFWYDEWAFVLGRRGHDLGTFLDPHNGHLSLVPILAYKALLAVAGMNHYWPYRLTVTAVHLLCAALIYIYAERRIGGWLALAATIPILFLGPAWQVIAWPFEMAWVASLAAGLGAFLMLDRRDRLGNVAAAALFTVSVASSGLGVAILIGALAETLLRRPRRPLVVAVPLGLYLLWYLGYSDSNLAASRIAKVPAFVADAFASSLASLVGLTGTTAPYRGDSLGWGRPLAVIVVVLVIWRLISIGHVPARVATFGATIIGFWVLTAISRAGVTVGGYSLAPPYSSRYVYMGAFFLVLIGVELLRGVRVSPTAGLVLGIVLAAGIVSHAGVFRDAQRHLRANATILTSNLGAIELARDHVAPTYEVGPYLTAGPYFAAEADWGTPARSPAGIAAAPEKQRAGADFVLAQIYGIAPVPARPGATAAGVPPAVDASGSGDLSTHGSCVSLAPSGYHPPWAPPELQLTVPPGGLLLRGEPGHPAQLMVRRFATGYPRAADGVLQGGRAFALRIPRDAAAQPWHVQLLPEGRITACGLG